MKQARQGVREARRQFGKLLLIMAANGVTCSRAVVAADKDALAVREVMRFGLSVGGGQNHSTAPASMVRAAGAGAGAGAGTGDRGTAAIGAPAPNLGADTDGVPAAGAFRRLPAGAEQTAVGSQLYLTAETIGVPEAMVDQIVRIFSGRLDFHRDLERGFDCTVLYRMAFDQGMIARPGSILAVRLATPAASLVAYLFDESGKPEPDGQFSLAAYFDADGRSLGSRFLQSPIQFSRITSGYAVRRFHPILQLWRAHTGTDYAAPVGTPVRVTADGVVRFVGVQGGYGNLVVVDHLDGLTSRYGHLSAFAPGLRKGSVVLQGDLLARVGMTGLATGPHLHYEMRRADKPFDPATLNTVTLSRGQLLPPPRLARFQAEKAVYDRQLALPLRTNLVERA